MKEITNDRHRHRIRTRIEQIKTEIRNEREFLEFAASNDFDYQTSYARIDGLKTEKRQLEQMLGYEHYKVISHGGHKLGNVKGKSHQDARRNAVAAYYESIRLEPIE